MTVYGEKELATICETRYVMTQHETRHVELEELKWSLEMPCMLPLCHRFATALGGLERIYSSKE